MGWARSTALVGAALALACGGRDGAEDRLAVAGYTALREAFGRGVLPAFRAEWRAATGRDVALRASYTGSGAQASAVVAGLPADVVVLALAADVDRIVDAGLVAPGWRDRTGNDGVVARTVVVIAVRPGNPLKIKDFPDLGGVEVVAPNPATSGAARWAVLALHLAGGAPLVSRVYGRVVVMDKGARESLVTFERGIGDAALTYEQEVRVAQQAGRRIEYVVPPSTLRVDLVGAVVDRQAAAHGRTDVADAFVRFLLTPAAQRELGAFGFRPATGDLAAAGPAFPPLGRVRGIEDLGGWARASALFADEGELTRALEEARSAR